MNWLDLMLAILMVWSVVSAFASGLSREVVGLVTVVAALVVSAWFYGTAGYYLLPFLPSRDIANLFGFFILFSAVWLVGGAIGMVVRRFTRQAGLGFMDRLLGACFGLLRGMVLAIALVLGIMAFLPGHEPPEAVAKSRLAPYVLESAHLCAAAAPYEFREGFSKSYSQVRHAWKKALGKENERE
jgi:membrane protein required for colicin V production